MRKREARTTVGPWPAAKDDSRSSACDEVSDWEKAKMVTWVSTGHAANSGGELDYGSCFDRVAM